MAKEKVQLIRSAPVDGVWHGAGTTIEVSNDQAADLRRMGKAAPKAEEKTVRSK